MGVNVATNYTSYFDHKWHHYFADWFNLILKVVTDGWRAYYYTTKCMKQLEYSTEHRWLKRFFSKGAYDERTPGEEEEAVCIPEELEEGEECPEVEEAIIEGHGLASDWGEFTKDIHFGEENFTEFLEYTSYIHEIPDPVDEKGEPVKPYKWWIAFWLQLITIYLQIFNIIYYGKSRFYYFLWFKSISAFGFYTFAFFDWLFHLKLINAKKAWDRYTPLG